MLAMVLMGAGMGLSVAPATESIMGALPLHQAGVGSAVNDTSREVGGALGVAIVGSMLSSLYSSNLDAKLPANVPSQVRDAADQSVGAALQVSAQLGRGRCAARRRRTRVVRVRDVTGVAGDRGRRGGRRAARVAVPARPGRRWRTTVDVPEPAPVRRGRPSRPPSWSRRADGRLARRPAQPDVLLLAVLLLLLFFFFLLLLLGGTGVGDHLEHGVLGDHADEVLHPLAQRGDVAHELVELLLEVLGLEEDASGTCGSGSTGVSESSTSSKLLPSPAWRSIGFTVGAQQAPNVSLP